MASDVQGPDRRAAGLVEDVSALIEQARDAVAVQGNAALTMRNWHIGRRIDVEGLREQRVGYAEEIVATLSRQLTARYGQSFDKSNLHRMIKFSQVFPDVEIVGTLSRQLT
ncbi:DUF1016 N-terminal domain-containing protein [Xylanimonas cellulosilytica]|uniref:DUF1016 N-terminal domain-containing protein n=1 Tax=Xylanimonas cellulosilytica TaxID=186189 RepID=UPI0011D1436E|nr:DUF1016 N-terminal domain-containing protein [Xylanimonas cellulosilytica]